MSAEYKLSSDAPYSIIVEGEGPLEPFVVFMGAKIIETLAGDLAEVPFTHENALKLRQYLRGKEVDIPPREKAILSYLANNPDSETDTNVLWSAELTDLIPFPAPGRFKKLKNGWDLIHYMPIRYLDKTNPQAVTELVLGGWSVIAGVVAVAPEQNFAKDYVKIIVADIKGARISATFFRQKWLAWQYKEGDEVVLYGNYSEYVNSKGQRFPQLTSAKIDKLGTVRGDLDMIPIYPQKQGDKSWQLQQAQQELMDKIVWIEDPVPLAILQKHKFMSRDEAYREIHFPHSRESIERARARVAFDEFVRLQVFLEQRRDLIEINNSAEKKALSWANDFTESLPFDFTEGQLSAIAEIKADMASSTPMYRLLQGDVGSGKAQPLYSKVLTPNGFKRMGDMKVGDEVLTPDGKQSIVEGVFPQGVRPVYEFTFKDGTKVRADENHLWSVNTIIGKSKKEPNLLMTTKELLEEVYLNNGLPKWHVDAPIVKDYGQPWNNYIDPYTTGCVTSKADQASWIKAISPVLSNFDRSSRLALLQGLLDSSGKALKGNSYEYVSGSKQISEDVAFLVRSLGGLATIRCKTSESGASYRVHGRLTNKLAPFRIEKNRSKYLSSSVSLPISKAITSIKYVKEELTQCIKLEDPKGLYITDGFTITHNTEISSVATLVAIESGYQVALLAPTDILATQLAKRFKDTFTKAGISDDKMNIALINARVTGKKRKALLEDLEKGAIDILIGTHAIINPAVIFNNLGLVVIDEQHKFGSEQRSALRNKGGTDFTPDFLMMSATPIPRTVSQVVYGDMDITLMKGAPTGRTPIKTEWHETPDLAWSKMREEVEKGHQAYVVASLVEESEKMENIESAEETYQLLSNTVFPDLRIGLLHGRLSKDDKEAVINKFYSGEVQILVATTVVEVGINVPNATVMTILNANRFGIASLHQIRGRVGRGLLASYCYLVGEATVPEAEERLNALVTSNDGFWLAEKDLEIRGEGSLFGQLQSGVNDMFIGNLKEHRDMLDLTKKVAKQAKNSVMLRKEVELLYTGKEIKA
jgi:ATP-dependent DNA helicase RecG